MPMYLAASSLVNTSLVVNIVFSANSFIILLISSCVIALLFKKPVFLPRNG